MIEGGSRAATVCRRRATHHVNGVPPPRGSRLVGSIADRVVSGAAFTRYRHRRAVIAIMLFIATLAFCCSDHAAVESSCWRSGIISTRQRPHGPVYIHCQRVGSARSRGFDGLNHLSRRTYQRGTCDWPEPKPLTTMFVGHTRGPGIWPHRRRRRSALSTRLPTSIPSHLHARSVGHGDVVSTALWRPRSSRCQPIQAVDPKRATTKRRWRRIGTVVVRWPAPSWPPPC